MSTDYNKGMYDIMKCIKRLHISNREGGNNEDIFDIFGEKNIKSVLEKFTPDEIQEYMNRWDKEQENRINIGDVISVGVDGDLTFLVTHINYHSDEYEGISSNGQTYSYPRDSPYIYKSQNHIDIWKILDKIKFN